MLVCIDRSSYCGDRHGSVWSKVAVCYLLAVCLRIADLRRYSESRCHIDLIGTWSSIASAHIRSIINIWNGVVVCACVLCKKKWDCTYTQHKSTKWCLGKVMKTCGIVEMRLRKWSGFMCKRRPVVERESS